MLRRFAGRREPEGVRLARVALVEHLGRPDADDRGTAVDLGFGGLTCRISAWDRASQGNLALWFDVDVPGRTTPIHLGISGIGASVEDQARQASHDFAEGVVKPLQHVYGEGAEDDDVLVGEATSITGEGPPMAWQLFAGPPTIFGQGVSTDDAAALRATIHLWKPVALIFDDFTGLLAVPALHWAKLFVMRIGDAPPRGEVALDNVANAHALEALAGLELPAGPTSVGFRQFIVASPRADGRRPDDEN